MSFSLDPPVLVALDALEKGDTEPLAQLLESEEDLASLPKFLTSDHRQMLARSLRKGAVRGRGPRPQNSLNRDRDIAIIVAYWEGYGAPGWSGEGHQNSVFHRVKADMEQLGHYMEAGSFRNIFRRYSPDRIAKLYMPDAFVDGATRGIGESDDRQAFLQRAIKRHVQLKLEVTDSWQQFLQLHANSRE